MIYSKFSERCTTPCLDIATPPPAFIKKLQKSPLPHPLPYAAYRCFIVVKRNCMLIFYTLKPSFHEFSTCFVNHLPNLFFINTLQWLFTIKYNGWNKCVILAANLYKYMMWTRSTSNTSAVIWPRNTSMMISAIWMVTNVILMQHLLIYEGSRPLKSRWKLS